jgi:glycosyltransferase involved in cell wall biosynthesis
LIVGLDASRNRSGGAKAHLIGLLGALDPRAYGISQVHVWSYRALLDALPEAEWLVKHHRPALERSLAHQIWWQARHLRHELAQKGCAVLLTTDAGSLCRFRPSVVMSRDMLSFEPREMARYGLSVGRLRLAALRHVQVDSLRDATGALFLTEYACSTIQQYTGPLARTRVIPHGISDAFRRDPRSRLDRPAGAPLRCLYVSNADVYKHQWHVVQAFAALRAAGHNVRLRLVGAATGPSEARVAEALARHDPSGSFVETTPVLPHQAVASELADADLFVFASSCENMPNTLVEAMASGLPIACSNRGPMPEILLDAGVYFDPEDPNSIAAAVGGLLGDPERRRAGAARAEQLARQYSWRRCAEETWRFLVEAGTPPPTRTPSR